MIIDVIFTSSFCFWTSAKLGWQSQVLLLDSDLIMIDVVLWELCVLTSRTWITATFNDLEDSVSGHSNSQC